MDKPKSVKCEWKDLPLFLLRGFDIPDMRRDITKVSNVKWLLRNIRVKNSTHERLDETIDLLKRQLKNLRIPKSS